MRGQLSMFRHGQMSANRTEPGPSFQLQRWPCVCHALKRLLIKTAQLKVENSAQTTFRFCPVRYRTPWFRVQGLQLKVRLGQVRLIKFWLTKWQAGELSFWASVIDVNIFFINKLLFLVIFSLINMVWYIKSGNTKRESITVLLTSSLTGLESDV